MRGLGIEFDDIAYVKADIIALLKKYIFLMKGIMNLRPVCNRNYFRIQYSIYSIYNNEIIINPRIHTKQCIAKFRLFSIFIVTLEARLNCFS